MTERKTFILSSLSLTLLFEGNNELPGFNIVGQEDLLWEELLHVRGNVQVFALHVRHKCVFEAFKRQNKHFLHHNRTQTHILYIL